ncbi:hypothetical protein Sjap_006818 [Stephania japonica]|uniref:Uncharacterized protein n=1 Tax=Stephania japonica TaxID=461633 RepID=A0AAP0K7R6_9MAGN
MKKFVVMAKPISECALCLKSRLKGGVGMDSMFCALSAKIIKSLIDINIL